MTGPLWTAEELTAATGGYFIGPCSALITGISIDTRTLAPGDLFIALKGENSDGHAHISTALEKGAAAVMVHDATSCDDPRLLVVSDTLSGLQALALAARARFAGKTIAVTGSVGKTTTKEMLRVALGTLGQVHAAEASYNNHWGVPLTLARLPREAAFCISEIGMNHPGEISPLAHMVRPDIAVITTIASAHIGYMGSLDAIAEEKSALISALPTNGIAVIPDDAHGQSFFTQAAAAVHGTLWSCGQKPDSTVRASDLHMMAEGSSFQAHTPHGTVSVRLNAPGQHLVRNALATLGVVAALKGDLPRAAAAMACFSPGKGRGAFTHIAGGAITLLDESYNASAASVKATLETLRLIPASRHIAILGDIRELGDFSTTEHAALAPVAAQCADLIFCCGPHMKSLYDSLPHAKQGAWAENSAALAPLACAALRRGDVLLVKGSLGSRMRVVIEALTALSHVEPA